MKRKNNSLTLSRAGEFSFVTMGDKHCGMQPAGNLQECKYIVSVKCDASTIDDNGYMFEQLKVQEYFDQITRVRSTCELLAIRIAEDLDSMIDVENPGLHVYWIEVTLVAAPYAASMTYKLNLN